jgi:glycosyltransferase involved in cell wall biosynthesis
MKHREQPLVTVILTAFNHQSFIEECMRSVFGQHYTNIQLIVIDNASSDGTLHKIEKLQTVYPDFILIKNLFNKGLCQAFNQGLALAKGKYVIDLSGDDVFLPERIGKQVEAFENCSEDYAVVFSNARYIDVESKPIRYHYLVNEKGKAIGNVPSGDVYKKILERYFICTPTMMIRTDALLKIGGYDESLNFEDFDFWIRSAVKYKYLYVDEVLTLKRNTPGSLQTQVYQKGSGILESYYAVCNKAYDLNRDQEEFDLLAKRIRGCIRKCFYAQEYELAIKFRKLLNYIENPGWQTEILVFLCRIRVPANFFYRFYINNIHKFFSRRKDLAFDIVN